MATQLRFDNMCSRCDQVFEVRNDNPFTLCLSCFDEVRDMIVENWETEPSERKPSLENRQQAAEAALTGNLLEGVNP